MVRKTGRYWNAILGNGAQSQCGWCKDGKRDFEEMMTINIAAIEAARRG
jgi:hypothetical protein